MKSQTVSKRMPSSNPFASKVAVSGINEPNSL